MSTDETLYDAAKILLEYTITKYYNYNGRTAPLSFASMLTKIQTDYDASISAGLTQSFLDNQVTRMLSFIKVVADVLNNEIDLSVIPSSDNLYFSGIFSPTSQDTSSYTIQTHHMFNDQPTGTMSSLVSTNIASTPRNITSFITGTDHFTQYSNTIRAGVWQTSIYATTTSVATPFPVMYTELIEVELDGTTQVGTVVATGTSTYGTTITGDGVFEVYLTVPLRVMGSTTNRLKLLLWAVNSDGTSTNVDLTLKINKLAMSNTETTIENITKKSVNVTGIQSIQGSKTFTGNTTLHGGAVVGNGLNGQIMYFDAEEDWIWKTDTTGSTNALVLKDATGDNSFIMEKFDNSKLVEFDLSTSSPGIISTANISAPDIVLVGGAYAGSLQSTLTEYYTSIETDSLISNLIDSSPALLNTLNELAAAIGDDENFSVTVANTIADLSDVIYPDSTKNNIVHKTASETIDGTKTFNSAVVASTVPSDNTHLTNKLYVNQEDTALQTQLTDVASIDSTTNNIVHKTASETIDGTKTFNSAVVASTVPSIDTHLTNKLYVNQEDTALQTQLTDVASIDSTTNNIVHKTSSETIAGEKTFTDDMFIKNSSGTSTRLHIIVPTDVDDARLTLGESTMNSSIGLYAGYLRYSGSGNDIALGGRDGNSTDNDVITYHRDGTTLELNPSTSSTHKIGGVDKLTITSGTTSISNTLAIGSSIANAETLINSKSNTTDVVLLSGNQNIDGVKRFNDTAYFSTIDFDGALLQDILDNKFTYDDRDITLTNITMTGTSTISANSQTVTDNEIGFLSGLASNAQTQLNSVTTNLSNNYTTTAALGNTFYTETEIDSITNDLVHKASTETISGEKTFSAPLTLTGGVKTNASFNIFKYGLWNSSTSTMIGHDTGYTFGSLTNYATVFTGENTSTANTNGWVWKASNHTKAQGFMALTHGGNLAVSESFRVGYGSSDSTTPSVDLDVSGAASIGGVLSLDNIVDVKTTIDANTAKVGVSTTSQTITGEKTFSNNAIFSTLQLDGADLQNLLDNKFSYDDRDITLDTITMTGASTISANSQTVTDNEIGFLSGLASNAQTQLTNISDTASSGTGTNNLVHKAGTETIAGTKTFNDDLIMYKQFNSAPMRFDIFTENDTHDARVSVGETNTISNIGKNSGYFKYVGNGNKIALGTNNNSVTDRDMITYNRNSQDLEFNPTITIKNQIGGVDKLTITSGTTTISNTLAITGFSDVSGSITTNASNIATNASNIATNASNISSNDTDIATNVTNITNLSSTSSAGTNVNNIVHKDGVETITGAKTFGGLTTIGDGSTGATIMSLDYNDGRSYDFITDTGSLELKSTTNGKTFKFTDTNSDVMLSLYNNTSGTNVTCAVPFVCNDNVRIGSNTNVGGSISTLQTEMNAVEADISTLQTEMTNDVVLRAGTATITGFKIFTAGLKTDTVGNTLPMQIGTGNILLGTDQYLGLGFGGYYSTIKNGILKKKTTDYARGEIHFCCNDVSDSTSVDLSDSKMSINSVGVVTIGLNTNVETSIAANTAKVGVSTTTQTITGVKTFSSNVVCNQVATSDNHLTNKAFVDAAVLIVQNKSDANEIAITTKANDNAVVKLKGDQTLRGSKKFENITIGSVKLSGINGGFEFTTSDNTFEKLSFIDGYPNVINDDVMTSGITNLTNNQSMGGNFTARNDDNSGGTTLFTQFDTEFSQEVVLTLGNHILRDQLNGGYQVLEPTNGSVYDTTKSYVCATYVKRLTSPSDDDGEYFYGPQNMNSYKQCTSGNPSQTNPYFMRRNLDQLETNNWYVTVAILHQSSSTQQSSNTHSGLYQVGNSTKITNASDYIFNNTTDPKGFRTFMFYDNESGTPTNVSYSRMFAYEIETTVTNTILQSFIEHLTFTEPTPYIVTVNGLMKIGSNTDVEGSINLKSNTADVVRLAGTQSISGGKTFTSPVFHGTDPTYNKVQLWSQLGSYAIGMTNTNSYGAIDTSNNYNTTFTMGSQDDWGWIWRKSSHNDASAAMGLTAHGILTIANKLRVGGGESDSTTASESLEVVGNIKATNLYGNNTRMDIYPYGSTVSSPSWAEFKDDNITLGCPFFRIYTGSTTSVDGSEQFRISSNGNVGIGTTNPGVALDVVGDITSTSLGSSKLTLRSINSSTVMIELIRNSTIFGADGNFDWRIMNDGGTFKIQSHSGGNNNVTYLQIGTTGIVNFYRNVDITGDIDISGTSTATAHTSTSDIRLKSNIQYLNTNTSLEKISRVKTAMYCINNKPECRYGIIAQELKQILPDAVNTNTVKCIESINELCELSSDGKTIILSNKKTSDILSMELKVKTTKTEKTFTILSLEGDDRINLETDITEYATQQSDGTLKIFVIGYLLRDVHSVNYNELFTVNIAATQELHSQLKESQALALEQQTTIESLQSELSAIKSFLREEFPDKFTMA
jgi:hypothetical protein